MLCAKWLRFQRKWFINEIAGDASIFQYARISRFILLSTCEYLVTTLLNYYFERLGDMLFRVLMSMFLYFCCWFASCVKKSLR